jgi:hypothetical protein
MYNRVVEWAHGKWSEMRATRNMCEVVVCVMGVCLVYGEIVRCV